MDKTILWIFVMFLVITGIMVAGLYFIFEEKDKLQIEINIHNKINNTVEVSLYLKNRFLTNYNIEPQENLTRYWVKSSHNLTYGQNQISIKWELNGKEYSDSQSVNLTKEEKMKKIYFYVE